MAGVGNIGEYVANADIEIAIRLTLLGFVAFFGCISFVVHKWLRYANAVKEQQ